MVDTLMEEISAKVSHVDEKRIAVFVALQMASKLFALESQIEHTSEYHKHLLIALNMNVLLVRHSCLRG